MNFVVLLNARKITILFNSKQIFFNYILVHTYCTYSAIFTMFLLNFLIQIIAKNTNFIVHAASIAISTSSVARIMQGAKVVNRYRR